MHHGLQSSASDRPCAEDLVQVELSHCTTMGISRNFSAGNCVLGLALLLSSTSLLSCSLLFSSGDQSESALIDAATETLIDAATETLIDAATETLIDASPQTNGCGLPILDETLAHYAMDEMTPSLTLSALDTATQPIDSLAIVGGGASAQGKAHTLGDGQCGNAASFSRENAQFLRLENSALAPDTVQSVDFWFRYSTPPLFSSSGNMGLLTKDGQFSGDGDLRILLVPNRGTENYRILSRLQNSDGGLAILCSEILLPSTWYHVAYSFSVGISRSTLHLNGVDISSDAIQRQIEDTADFVIAEDCGFESFSARTTTLVNNSHDWAIGASNDAAPTTEFIRIMDGDIDELRFRSQVFDENDAKRIRDYLLNQ